MYIYDMITCVNLLDMGLQPAGAAKLVIHADVFVSSSHETKRKKNEASDIREILVAAAAAATPYSASSTAFLLLVSIEYSNVVCNIHIYIYKQVLFL